jgi:multicomponent Na+:H+ antiporter subunit E
MSRKKLSLIPKVWGWVLFGGFYLGEVIKSNLFILWDVLTPGHLSDPSIIAVDLPEEMSDIQILLVSNLVTMTPGTLSLELTSDRKKLLIQILYTGDVEATRNHISQNYVHRVFSLS